MEKRKHALSWLVKELKRAGKEGVTGTLLIEDKGGLSLAWGEPTHAFWEGGQVGRLALAQLFTYCRQDFKAGWDKLVLGDTLRGLPLDEIIQVSEGLLRGKRTEEEFVLPHSPEKTTSAQSRLSLDRFPILPQGSRLLLTRTEVDNIRWEELIADISGEAMIILSHNDFQGVMLVKGGRFQDALYVSRGEETVAGTAARQFIIQAEEGTVVAWELAKNMASLIAALWRTPVRWDTLPLEILAPQRWGEYLGELKGETICVVETEPEAWVLGIRDGYIYGIWSETDRRIRLSRKELQEVFSQPGGWITVQRGMEGLRELPVHPGTLPKEIGGEDEPDLIPLELARLWEVSEEDLRDWVKQTQMFEEAEESEKESEVVWDTLGERREEEGTLKEVAVAKVVRQDELPGWLADLLMNKVSMEKAEDIWRQCPFGVVDRALGRWLFLNIDWNGELQEIEHMVNELVAVHLGEELGKSNGPG